MLNRTKEIKKDITEIDSIEERLDFIKDKYSDKTAYVVTCGPSLKEHDRDKLLEILK